MKLELWDCQVNRTRLRQKPVHAAELEIPREQSGPCDLLEPQGWNTRNSFRAWSFQLPWPMNSLFLLNPHWVGYSLTFTQKDPTEKLSIWDSGRDWGAVSWFVLLHEYGSNNKGRYGKNPYHRFHSIIRCNYKMLYTNGLWTLSELSSCSTHGD